MALFKMVRPGTWWVRSASDPRWNGQGTAATSIDRIPPQASAHVEALRPSLGEPPADLEVGFDRHAGQFWNFRNPGRKKPKL